MARSALFASSPDRLCAKDPDANGEDRSAEQVRRHIARPKASVHLQEQPVEKEEAERRRKEKKKKKEEEGEESVRDRAKKINTGRSGHVGTLAGTDRLPPVSRVGAAQCNSQFHLDTHPYNLAGCVFLHTGGTDGSGPRPGT